MSIGITTRTRQAWPIIQEIWCRDYMPIQMIDNRFVLFCYEPDYLLDTAKHKASITDNSIAGQYVGSSYLEDSRGIKIDGGNVVHSGCKVIMTAKVFEENPQWTPRDLIEYLTRAFGADIIILPWDTNEIYGHTDGIVRFIDDDSVLITNYAQTEKVLILPKFNIQEDQEAYEQIARLMPSYKDRIEMVDATDLIRYEGCLNCASWTFLNTPNLDLP